MPQFYDKNFHIPENRAKTFCLVSDLQPNSAPGQALPEGDWPNHAAKLFEKQVAGEKRRLLDFVVSNCRWADGELIVKFRQPFDLIAVGATESIRLNAAGGVSNALHPLKYPREDSNH
jgi:hypothetical protein